MSEHVRQPLRITGREIQPRMCSCGKTWADCERDRSAEGRWQALRDWLTAAFEDLADSDPETRLGSIMLHKADAYKRALDKMDALEAQR